MPRQTASLSHEASKPTRGSLRTHGLELVVAWLQAIKGRRRLGQINR